MGINEKGKVENCINMPLNVFCAINSIKKRLLAVRTTGDIVMKKNEHLPYCPPELVARHTNEYYQVDTVCQ